MAGGETRSIPLLVSVFVAQLFSSHEVLCVKELKRTTGQGLSYANFLHHEFQYLNVSTVEPSYVVRKVSACNLACVNTLACFSLNVAVQPDMNGYFQCELLASDKYNSSDKFQAHPNFHHYSIYTPCSKMPCSNGGSCIALYHLDDFRCKCPAGYKGKTCEIAPADCAELSRVGVTENGLYSVNPDGKKAFQVFCDMTTDGGGWTVFQRRQNGSQDFAQGWAEYKAGFGLLNGEFWLGNEKIHRLTAGKPHELRVEIEDWNASRAYAIYGSFKVGNEQSLYSLSFGSYSGTAGDALATSNTMKFTTKDKDNDKDSDKNCASIRGDGGWWFRRCSWCNLNGKYYLENTVRYGGIVWFHYKDKWLSMKSAEMKLRTEE